MTTKIKIIVNCFYSKYLLLIASITILLLLSFIKSKMLLIFKSPHYFNFFKFIFS